MKHIPTSELIYLRDKLDRLERIQPIATRSFGPCGHARRGSFPACRECMQKEIEKRKEQQ